MRSVLWGGLSFAGLVAAMLHASTAVAIGLGEVEVTSPLGRALDARLPLILEPGEEAEFVRVRLLPQGAYEGYGLPLPGLRPDEVTATVEPRSTGGYWLLLRGQRPIREPAIELLIEVSHGSARITRGLPLLFDVPKEAATVSVRAASPSAVAVGEAPAKTPAPAAAASPTPNPPVAAAANPDAAAGKTYGPVAAGESLRAIAERVRPFPNYGLRRVMTALLIANPDAFTGRDRSPQPGSVLQVPDARTMLDLDADTITAHVGPGRTAPAQSRKPAAPAPSAIVERAPAVPAEVPALERIVLDLAALPAEPGIGRRLALTETLDARGLALAAEAALEAPLSADADLATDDAAFDAAGMTEDAAELGIADDAPAAARAASSRAAAAGDALATGAEDTGSSLWAWILALLAGAAGVYAFRRWRAERERAPWAPVQVSQAREVQAPKAAATPVAFAEVAAAPPPIRLVRPVPPAPGAAAASPLQARIQRLQSRGLNAEQRQKVALAAAYLDMGDETSALQLLDEAEGPTGKGPARRA